MMPGEAGAPSEADKLHRAREAGWVWAEEVRVAAAEALGTALLVALACVSPGPLSAGLSVCMLVQCLDHVSGAMFNPTVTLAAAVWGRVSARRAAAMVCAQLAGATLGAAAAGAMPGPGARAGMTRVPAALSPWVACCVEATCSACLALANCAGWDPRNARLRDSWPLRIGATVAALSLAANGLSGASFNPARSFGPALLARDWTHHWVYWAGPLGGSIAASALYCAVWRPPQQRNTHHN